jgi:2-amino-4-hydroxy-6-hydroxymethyldihydropteridine diphosphokinase
MKAAVALGSNLGDRLGNLTAARKAISKIESITSMVASPIYETEPVGCEPRAPAFLNAVLVFSNDSDPVQLFARLRHLEIVMGRPVDHRRNVSRPIDIDLLYCGDAVLKTQELTLPHPRIIGRRFVLQPLADVDPNLVLPGQKRTIRELLASAPQSATVVRSSLEWEVR